MKRYKIGKRIVKANSIADAVKISKLLDSLNARVKMSDSRLDWYRAMKEEHVRFHRISLTSDVIQFNSRKDYDRALELADKYDYDRADWDPRKLTLYDRGLQTTIAKYNSQSTHDSNNSEIEELTQEEEKAVEDYRRAIQGTTNPKLLEIYSHILKEETEHIQELAEAKEIEDACGKMKDVPDLETKSGRKMTFEQIAMSALDKVPTRMWNKIGDKITINNNSIILSIREDGVYFSTPDRNYGRYTNKFALQEDILKELNLD